MYIECAHFHNDYNVNKMRVNLRYANSSSNPSPLRTILASVAHVDKCTEIARSSLDLLG